MSCQACGYSLQTGWLACPQCGASLAAIASAPRLVHQSPHTSRPANNAPVQVPDYGVSAGPASFLLHGDRLIIRVAEPIGCLAALFGARSPVRMRDLPLSEIVSVDVQYPGGGGGGVVEIRDRAGSAAAILPSGRKFNVLLFTAAQNPAVAAFKAEFDRRSAALRAGAILTPAPPDISPNRPALPPPQPTSPDAVAIIWLLFFFPVGLYFMWARTTWPPVVKWIITIVIAFCMVASAITPSQHR